MITENNKLQVFESFSVDGDLPKFSTHKKSNHVSYKGQREDESILAEAERMAVDLTQEEDGEIVQGQPEIFVQDSFASANISRTDFEMGNAMGVMVRNWREQELLQVAALATTKKVPWYRRWFTRKPKATTEKKKVREELEPTLMSIEDFFLSVKLSQKEIVIVKERMDGYKKALVNAKSTGQRALYEQVASNLVACKNEAHLLSIGVTKYLEEEDVVKFYKQAQKGVRLDWVRNFTRTIPLEITERKVAADRLGLFDNYVVMHYDPKMKSYAQTQAEKEAERRRREDPILFGLMKGKRVLYFVGDWADATRDLTLDKTADLLGKSVVKEII